MANRMTNTVAAVATALVLASAPLANAAGDDSWSVELTPYLWGTSIDADVKVRGRSASVNASFSDILDNLDLGGGLLTRGQYNSWVMRTQVDYLDMSVDLDHVKGSLDSQTTMGTLAFGYQFKPMQHVTTDVLLGVRYFSLDNKLQVNAIGTFKRERDLTDPIAIVQPAFQLSRQWALQLLLAYGAGGDSDYNYEVTPELKYQPWRNVVFRAGYRRIYYKVKSDNNTNRFDGSFEGPFLGVGVLFGSAPKAAAAVAATPSPSEPVAIAPPPPQDTDNDGVADADDQCPTTPAGQRVDSVGCGYEISMSVHFDTNSATITSDSYASLDQVVDLLKRVPTMRGAIEGYTDSTGRTAYNQALSERRAAAVAEYLVQHGIGASRIPPRGFGESDPVADNATAQGRAQNRRVVLHRTDRGN